MKWINIEDEIPEQESLLVYLFDRAGTSLGFYFGISKDFPSTNNHVFGGNFGFITGQVTHWAYIPEYPQGYEDDAEKNAEYARVLRREVNETIKPIGSARHGSLNNYTSE